MNKSILVFFIGVLTFGSCKKEEGNIVLEGQGNQNQLGLFINDTTSFTARTVDEDSLPGNGIRYALLGHINDPILGKSTASLYANVVLIEPNSNFPVGGQSDSAILFIPSVDGLNIYGDRTTPQLLKIDKLESVINSSNVYYQNNKFDIDENYTTYFTGSLINQYTDSLKYRKTKLKPYDGLKIKLSKKMADLLMNLPKEAYQTNEQLAKYFKGISIIPQDNDLAPNTGAMNVFDINNILSLAYRAKIMLYYQDTNTFVFGFAGSTSSVTTGKTGPYNGEINQQLSSTSNFNKTYVQALGGVKTKVEMPYILNLIQNGNISINKAEIEFFLTDYDENFFAPPRLNLFQPAKANSVRNYFIADALLGGSYGGLYNSKTQSYKFTVTRHIQNILNEMYFNKKNVNNGLYLAVPTDQPVIGARGIIDHSKTKINIIYSKPN